MTEDVKYIASHPPSDVW